MSINLAPETLAHPAFMQQIDACLGRHRVHARLHHLRDARIVGADAPTRVSSSAWCACAWPATAWRSTITAPGSSNLQLLARIPFSELKIDRSFVDGASKKRALGTVLSSCLGLARSLDRMSVAVGVETKQDWDFLQGLGCTYAQGYHIARRWRPTRFPRLAGGLALVLLALALIARMSGSVPSIFMTRFKL